MRVITGKYKGRHFDVPRSFKARPTTDFAKENLFNVLQAYFDFETERPRALDLFAGTGSITLELLSRGCAQVTSVEKDYQHCALIRSFISKLNDHNALVIQADVFRFISRATQSYDIIFADPPYTLPELSLLPDLVLHSEHILAPDGLFILEHGKNNNFSQHPRFVEERIYGAVHFTLFQ